MGVSLVGAWANTMDPVLAIKAAARRKVFMAMSFVDEKALDRTGRAAVWKRRGWQLGRRFGDRVGGVGVARPERLGRTIGCVMNRLAL